MSSGSQAITLSESDFQFVAELVKGEAGIVLDSGKLPMVQSRLMKRLRKLRISNFDRYIGLIREDANSSERRELISALTTNVTHFFRESHHFDTLRTEVLVPFGREASDRKRLRIWSAGCSYGNEPYSIAITCQEVLGNRDDVDVKILATDIDPQVLQIGRSGVYETSQVEVIPETIRAKYFAKSADGDNVQVSDNTRRLVKFNELNLLRDWPMRGPFDAVFCRNVVIYFDADTQVKLWKRFHAIMKPGASLFVGHSERIPSRGMGLFEPSGVTTYKRV